MKASYRRVIRALEDGAVIRDLDGGEVIVVKLNGERLFQVKRETLYEMLSETELPIVSEWRLL